jgi:hypothetical protein
MWKCAGLAETLESWYTRGDVQEESTRRHQELFKVCSKPCDAKPSREPTPYHATNIASSKDGMSPAKQVVGSFRDGTTKSLEKGR